jgi:hypothetical protein
MKSENPEVESKQCRLYFNLSVGSSKHRVHSLPFGACEVAKTNFVKRIFPFGYVTSNSREANEGRRFFRQASKQLSPKTD